MIQREFAFERISAAAKAAPLSRKKNEPLNAPPCDACKAAGAKKSNAKNCKRCRAVRSATWRAKHPDRHKAIVARFAAKQAGVGTETAKARTKLKSSRSVFRRRYATDAKFREYHKQRVQKWAMANPDKIAQKAKKQAAGYKRLSHEPVVYFVLSHLTGLVKIGTTINLSARVSGLRCSHPGKLAVLGCLNGGQPIEAQVHSRFAASRFDGEWFVDTPALRAYISEHCAAMPQMSPEVSLQPGTRTRKGKNAVEVDVNARDYTLL